MKKFFTAAVFFVLIVSQGQATPVKKQSVRTVAFKASVAVDPPTPTQPPQTQPEQTPVVDAPAPPPQTPVSGSHEDWMSQAGIDQNDWAAVDFIVSHESTWCPYVHEGEGYCPSSPDYVPGHAYGLCQALPATKMADAGADWLTNPVTQLKWCSTHAAGYGGWWSAYSAWVSQHWW